MYWCNICEGVFEYPEEKDNTEYLIDSEGHEYVNAVNFTQVCPFCKNEWFDAFLAIYECLDCGFKFTEFPKLGHECCPNCGSIEYKEMEGEE